MSTFRQKFQATTNWVKPDPEDLDEAPRKARRAPARSRRRAAAPVTAHRLFPAFAAVWFAALLGLGSLAIPGNLLGAIVLRTGLPALVPAAAPPLGFTAHLLVAFVLTGFGAALGLALGLRLRPANAGEARAAKPIVPAAPAVTTPEVDTAYKVRARDAHPDAPPRRPLVLTEALGDPLGEETAEPEPEPAAPLLRRKRGPVLAEPVSEPTPYLPEYTPGGPGVVRPLDLSALDLDEPVEEPRFAQPEPVAMEIVAEPEAAPAPEPAAPEPAAPPAPPALIAATPQLPVGFAAALPELPEGKRSPVAGAPLEKLGLVQLIERLALAIAEQKAANEAVIAADNAGPAAADPAAANPAAGLPEFEPGPFSRPHIAVPAGQVADVPAIGSARESILRRLGAIAAGEAVDAADSAASARLFTRPVPVAAPVTAPIAAPTDAVVPLRPVEAPAASVEADEALRSALATLQRMSARA